MERIILPCVHVTGKNTTNLYVHYTSITSYAYMKWVYITYWSLRLKYIFSLFLQGDLQLRVFNVLQHCIMGENKGYI